MLTVFSMCGAIHLALLAAGNTIFSSAKLLHHAGATEFINWLPRG